MPRIPGLRRFFRLDRGAADVERDVNTEIDFHFAMKVQELVSRGYSPDDARAEARRRFGDVDRTRERLSSIDRGRVERERRAEWWESVAQDLRYALRGLRMKPGFTAGVIITLGLGIGANATMFGIVDRLLLRPPAFLRDPSHTHRLYLNRTFGGEVTNTSNIGYRRYTQLTEWSKSLDRTAAFFNAGLAVGSGTDARERRVSLVSASFFGFFNIQPVIGRFFLPDEDRTPEGKAVAVLGYGFWKTQYAGARDVLGKQLSIGRQNYTIIGVAPKGFVGTDFESPVAFVPITAAALDLFGGRGDPTRYFMTHNMSWMEMLAHRKPGVSLEAATADLTTAFRRSYAEEREMRKDRAPAIESVKPNIIVASVLRERGPNQGNDSKVATWLVGVALIVLLIACANVANLLLARALRRRREIAVRLALGVSRSRLLGQLFLESVLLAVLGGAAGLVLAQFGGGLLRAAFLQNVEWTNALVDPRMLLFAGTLALLAGLLTGVAPAVQSRRGDLASSLKAGAREGTYHRSRLRTALLILQGALSVVLLTGAGLFVRSLHNVNDVHLGYDADNVAFVQLEMRGARPDSAAASQLREQLIARARALPFVSQASRAWGVPFWMSINQDLYVAGIDSVNKLGDFYLHAGDPSYFATMGTRIVRGRGFESSDRATSPLVAVISQSMAKTLWPGKEALGQCMKINADTVPCTTVVGIAEDIRRSSMSDEKGLQYYLPSAQIGMNTGGLFVRTRGNARLQVENLRRELQQLMPGTSYVSITSLREILDPNFRPWQIGATMFSIFGGLALVLAAVGLYSVISYTVTQRSHEMGVRVALGAQSGDVVRLVVKEGLRVAVVGLALGLVVSLFTSRFVAQLLFDVPPRDPVTMIAVTVTLLIVAIAASVIPARRAAGVDPNTALRAD